jgi:hypothetical protein
MERKPEPRKEVKGGVKRSGTESEASLDCMSSGGRSERRRRRERKFPLVVRRQKPSESRGGRNPAEKE